jgi:hypothetical protein
MNNDNEIGACAFLLCKASIRIPLSKIRPTNPLRNTPEPKADYPIVVVNGKDGYYYILDGNHRWYYSYLNRGGTYEIETWVLEEGDQIRIKGNPLPWPLEMWVKGKCNLNTLTESAIEAHYSKDQDTSKKPGRHRKESVEKLRNEQISPILEKSAIGAIVDCRDKRQLALTRVQVVLRLIKGDITIGQAEEETKVDARAINRWYRSFLQAGTNALERESDEI